MALEPKRGDRREIEDLRDKAALAALPAEYQGIEASPTVTRAQLAALIGVRLDALLKRRAARDAVVITDMRGNWAAPWILAVARAGVMEVYREPHVPAATRSSAARDLARPQPRRWRSRRSTTRGCRRDVGPRVARFPDLPPKRI